MVKVDLGNAKCVEISTTECAEAKNPGTKRTHEIIVRDITKKPSAYRSFSVVVAADSIDDLKEAVKKLVEKD